TKAKSTFKQLRWDRAVLSLYYDKARDLLYPLFDRINKFWSDGSGSVDSTESLSYCNVNTNLIQDRLFDKYSNATQAVNVSINKIEAAEYNNEFYSSLVNALVTAADLTIPAIKSNTLKF